MAGQGPREGAAGRSKQAVVGAAGLGEAVVAWAQAAVQNPERKPGHAQKSHLWPDKGVREKRHPSLTFKWVFGVLISLGLLV